MKEFKEETSKSVREFLEFMDDDGLDSEEKREKFLDEALLDPRNNPENNPIQKGTIKFFDKSIPHPKLIIIFFFFIS